MKFFRENIEIFIVFVLVILSSNLWKLFTGLSPKQLGDVFVTFQQFGGAPVLFTYLYFHHIPRKLVFKKSLALGLFVLSSLSLIGEVLNIFGIKVLDQTNKGQIVVCEHVFVLTIVLVGLIFYKKYE